VNKFIESLKVWTKKSKLQRQKLLKAAGRDPILANRSYPHLPSDVRQDVQPALLKELPQPETKQYWWNKEAA